MNYTKPAVLTADKTLKRESIVMIVHPDEVAKLPEPTLPEGYSFRLYQPGDARTWAHITTIVDEYDNEEQAEASFTRGFMPEEEELKRRLVFVIAPDGSAVATSMAWMFEENGQRFGRVHWICNDPAHQGKGIGRAIVLWAMKRIAELEPGLDQYLDTQTWSHKAIGLYLRLGFHPVKKSHPILRGANDYDEAVEVLRTIVPDKMPEAVFKMFIENAED